MSVHLRCPIQLTSSYGRKFLFSSLNSKLLIISKATAMETNLGIKSKRPSCPNCSKPLSVCLCSRIKSPNLDNEVKITILQHSLEKNHPLNTTRIATLGLKNLSVATVFDVHFGARFDIQRTPPVCENASQNKEISEHPLWFSLSIEKYGKMNQMIRNLELEEIMNSSSMMEEIMATGFVVKKLRMSEEDGSMEVEEFEITIPPRTAVLFPTQDSVGVKEVDFSVKNLIVLDGTWAKANRIYNENPWLRLLPCVRLDVDKVSLYGEVRNEPKPGFLSTLESIVYALEAFGEKKIILEGLENLLDVFESMVDDQRRCMKERLESEAA